MANRFDNQRGTAPIVDSIKNEKAKVRYSQVDLTSKISFDAGIGWIIPFDLIETLPDSDYELSYDMVAITRNPLVRRLLSGMSVYIHTYAEDLKDMWDGFPRFITKGRSGTFNGQIPVTKNSITGVFSNEICSHTYSPSAFLGIPPRIFNGNASISSNDVLRYYGKDSSVTTLNPVITFNALPLVMYQQICIHNYLPSNLLQGNKNYFPDNERHLLLPDEASGRTVYNLSYDISVATTPTSADITDVTISNNSSHVFLDNLRVRQFRGDEFTTAMPFADLVRGTMPSISLGSVTVDVGQQDVIAYLGQITAEDHLDGDVGIKYTGSSITGAQRDVTLDSNLSITYTPNSNQNIGSGSSAKLRTAIKEVDITLPSTVTLSQLRSLAVATKFAEMMARTDGSYNQMIKAHFNSSPDLHVGKPLYIGGMKQDMVFSEVVQTSQSTDDSPQGATNSRGVTAGSGYIGKYHSKDYGYIMSVLSVVPDVYYHQGLEKKWSRISQSDFYFPINNNLSPEALLNKRLYVSGNASTDDNLFGYQERDSDYKSRRNRVAGNLVLTASQSEEDNAYVMKRNFSTTPTLSYGFTGMFPSNIDMTVFTTTTDTPFIFNIASRCKAKLPMPYITVPSDLGIE